MDLERLARYPYLPEAREYVEKLGLSLKEMLAHPVYSGCIDYGRRRLEGCLEREYKPVLTDKLSMELTLLAYPIARLIAAGSGSRRLVEEYARGEADLAYSLLQDDSEDQVKSMAVEVGLNLKGDSLYYLDFINLAGDLTDNPAWRLVNQSLKDGWIRLEPWQLRRLLAMWVKVKTSEEIDASEIPKLLREMGKSVSHSKSKSYRKVTVESLEEDALPPCIEAIISRMADDSADHQDMFVLGTFLVNLGLSEEKILGVLRKSPKYDESTARYQLKFISGEKSGTEYTCPSCDTLRTQGVCVAECDVKHPLQYYRRNSRKVKSKKK